MSVPRTMGGHTTLPRGQRMLPFGNKMSAGGGLGSEILTRIPDLRATQPNRLFSIRRGGFNYIVRVPAQFVVGAIRSVLHIAIPRVGHFP